MHTDADAVATADFEEEEGAVNWHVYARRLVSWHQTQLFDHGAVVMDSGLVCAW